VLTIAPELEQKIFESKYETHSGVVCALDPATQQAWIRAVSKAASAVTKNGYLPVILCSEKVRYLVKNSTDRELPNLAVLSVPEITTDIIPEALGVIRIEGGE
jgi:flagellar biosynthesis protein FlhA